MSMQQCSFVLLTAARNEQDTIEKTILSVISQTKKPLQWAIVSDASTDDTDSIVARYASEHNFIKHVIINSNIPRGVPAKVNALGIGCRRFDVQYQFVGCVDADVSFDENYFAKLLDKFRQNPRLGIAGGVIFELIGAKFYPQRTSASSVAGAVQFFRRACFEDIGGYVPIIYGGEDAAAEITARYHGWETACCRDLAVFHHRRVSMGAKSMLSARFRQGRMDYVLGYSLIFEFVRCFYRIIERPLLFGSISRFCGFISSMLSDEQRALPADVIQFLRAEQLSRLRAMFSRH